MYVGGDFTLLIVSYNVLSGVDRVADDAESTTEGKHGEVCRCQLPAWSVHLSLALCVILIICGNCVTLSIGHKFSVELALRWMVVCLTSFVLYIVFDTIKVRFAANYISNRYSLFTSVIIYANAFAYYTESVNGLAPFLVTLSDRQDHSPIVSFLTCDS